MLINSVNNNTVVTHSFTSKYLGVIYHIIMALNIPRGFNSTLDELYACFNVNYKLNFICRFFLLKKIYQAKIHIHE